MSEQLTHSNVGKGILAVGILIIIVVTATAWVPFSVASEVEVNVGLDGTSWKLEAIDGKAVLADSRITAQFQEGQLAGSAGVNNYFAGYEMAGGSLSIGLAGATMMMGPEELMDQEMAFLSALQSVKSFRVDGDTLTLVTEGGVLTFAADK